MTPKDSQISRYTFSDEKKIQRMLYKKKCKIVVLLRVHRFKNEGFHACARSVSTKTIKDQLNITENKLFFLAF